MAKVEAMHEARAAKSSQEGADTEEAAGGDEAVIDIEAKPEITYDDFAESFSSRLAKLFACEEVKKSKSFYAPR